MIERIAKLLALAEAATTTAEAEVAFAKAQQLASKFEIDMELARLSLAPKERQQPVQRTIRIGEKGKHANASHVNLFLGVAQANGVECLIAHNSTYVIAHGFPSDIDTVETLWTSLMITMTKFADALVRDKNAEWRQETIKVWDNNEWCYVEKKVTGQGARRSFSDGFVGRIKERLNEARRTAIQAADDHFHNEPVADEEGSNLPSSMALVLKSKKEEVETFMWDSYKQQYGRSKPRGSWSGSSSATSSGSARSAGRAAANNASLSAQRGIAR